MCPEKISLWAFLMGFQPDNLAFASILNIRPTFQITDNIAHGYTEISFLCSFLNTNIWSFRLPKCLSIASNGKLTLLISSETAGLSQIGRACFGC